MRALLHEGRAPARADGLIPCRARAFCCNLTRHDECARCAKQRARDESGLLGSGCRGDGTDEQLLG